MAVSRSGKHGRRAGGKTHRPASRNRRVIVNAGLQRITREEDGRPSARRVSKEQWVVQKVMSIVGTYAGPNFISADDTASDILFDLVDQGGLNWEEDEIIHFCRKRAMFMVRIYLARREKTECEFQLDDPEELTAFFEKLRLVVPDQETCYQASVCRGLLRALPIKHRAALEILADGGNPIHVAEELGLTPWDAIKLIKEARDFADRVDPLDDAA